jgi:hypothetical protein
MAQTVSESHSAYYSVGAVGCFPGPKSEAGCPPHPVPRLRISGTIPAFHPYAFMAGRGTDFKWQYVSRFYAALTCTIITNC